MNGEMSSMLWIETVLGNRDAIIGVLPRNEATEKSQMVRIIPVATA